MESAGIRRFIRQYPRLFHVTDRSCLPSIRRYGLLPAVALCELFEVPSNDRPALLDDNRDRYVTLTHPCHGTAVLRRQLLRDHVMASRLAPGWTPARWRRFINGMTFLLADAARAAALRAYDAERDQIILVWHTAAIIEAGIELRTCRYNNGMVDRLAVPRRRLRGPDDYVPLAHYGGGRIAEITAPGIPAAVPCAVWDGCT